MTNTKRLAELNEAELQPEHTVKRPVSAEADEPDAETDDGTELYILDIRHTPLATKFLAEGAAAVRADRIVSYLAKLGYARAAERGVTVRPDGKVFVFSDTDPSADWQRFTNDPSPEEAADAGPLVKLRAFKAKADKGTATAKDVADIVPVIVGAMLKAYGQE